MSYKFESYVYLDADEMFEIECVVKFDYQPAEKMTSNYPGCKESVEIFEVSVDGGSGADDDTVNVLDDISCYDRDRLNEECLDFMHDRDERDYETEI